MGLKFRIFSHARTCTKIASHWCKRTVFCSTLALSFVVAGQACIDLSFFVQYWHLAQNQSLNLYIYWHCFKLFLIIWVNIITLLQIIHFPTANSYLAPEQTFSTYGRSVKNQLTQIKTGTKHTHIVWIIIPLLGAKSAPCWVVGAFSLRWIQLSCLQSSASLRL